MQSVKLFAHGVSGLDGLPGLFASSHPGAPAIEFAAEAGSGLASFRRALEAGAASNETTAFAVAPDIVVLSLEADLRASDGSWGSGEADQFEADLRAVVRLVKTDLGSHVIILNASSVDPEMVVGTYQGLEHEPPALRTHRFNLATMRVSSDEGVSIVDADRLVAELGGSGVVTSFLTYGPGATEAIRRELVRVVDDYGFLDDRPILPQVGRDTTP